MDMEAVATENAALSEVRVSFANLSSQLAVAWCCFVMISERTAGCALCQPVPDDGRTALLAPIGSCLHACLAMSSGLGRDPACNLRAFMPSTSCKRWQKRARRQTRRRTFDPTLTRFTILPAQPSAVPQALAAASAAPDAWEA